MRYLRLVHQDGLGKLRRGLLEPGMRTARTPNLATRRLNDAGFQQITRCTTGAGNYHSRLKPVSILDFWHNLQAPASNAEGQKRALTH